MNMLPKNRNYDKKIFRIWAILNKLDGRRAVSTRELAEEFNVTTRTVQRDIQLLNMAGFPVVAEERGKHTFAEGFSLKKISVSEEEASLLSFLYEIAKSLGENFEESFRGILRKVLAKDVGSAFYFKIPDGIKLDKQFPVVKDIEHAIDGSVKVEICYLKAEGEKQLKVDPLKIIFFDGFWYLLARIDGKEWIVKLRLENIKSLTVLDEYFEAPENLKTIIDESVNIWFSEKRDKKVVLKVGKDVARYFKQRKYFPLQRIRKENRDGSLIIESKVSEHMEVIPNILKWIPSVKVVSPEALKKRIRKDIEQYLRG